MCTVRLTDGQALLMNDWKMGRTRPETIAGFAVEFSDPDPDQG